MNEILPNGISSILIIEDQLQLRRFLRTTLIQNGYHVLDAATAVEGLRQVGLFHPDLIILDLDLSNVDGLEIAQQLRKWASMPIILLSAEHSEPDTVVAADIDYLVKPLNADELLAHIDLGIRHLEHGRQPNGITQFAVGRLRVDMARRQVYVKGAEIHLSPLEYKLLTVLIRYAGKVVTRASLLKEVWGPSYSNQNHCLRIYISYLRHKIEDDPERPQFLLTEPGKRYRLKAD